MRQGCPLSVRLFILAVEVLAIKLRRDPEIKGIKLFESVEIKILQFADDATLFVDDKDSLKKVIQKIENLSSFSGLQLNKSKCSVLDISGKSRGDVNGIPITDSDVKILGVHFGKNEQNLIDHNWTSKTSKIENIIRLWKS